MRRRGKKEAEAFATEPGDPTLVAQLRKAVDLIPILPFWVTLWEVQNICHAALVKAFEERCASADPAMQQYFDHLVNLAEGLHIRAPQPILQS